MMVPGVGCLLRDDRAAHRGQNDRRRTTRRQRHFHFLRHGELGGARDGGRWGIAGFTDRAAKAGGLRVAAGAWAGPISATAGARPDKAAGRRGGSGTSTSSVGTVGAVRLGA